MPAALPLPDTTILFFGNDWSADNRTSSHHIARFLSSRYRLIYIECPGMRSVRASGRDFRRVWSKLAKALRGARRIDERLHVATLLQIPIHRFAWARWLNRRFVIGQLRFLTWRLRVERPILWFMIPHVPDVLGIMGEQLSVYSCTDHHASLPDVDSRAVQDMDERMTSGADLVFVASETLLDEKRRLNPRTYVSPHGVDIEHFARAQTAALPAPPELADIPRPIIGFFGLIERWIDLELIDYLAERRPQWSFLVIGRVAVPWDSLPRRPNVTFPGPRPYEDLPAYGRAFDVAVLPYRHTNQVHHANPLKLREYLAMGKPIVAVNSPEIDKYADVVRVAHSHEEFLGHLDAILGQPDSADDIQRRMARVADEGWPTRIERLLTIAGERLREKTAGN